MFQFYFLLMTVIFPLLYLAYNFSSKRQRYNIPPGPPGLPVVGHLHLITKPLLHRFFHGYTKKYGPIFTLRFGYRRVVVISSYPLVKECFSGPNDIILSNRPLSMTNKYIAYNHTTIGTSPYNEHWRNLRRISSVEILSSHRLASFLDIRRDELRRMLRRLARDHTTNGKLDSFKKVELEPPLSDLALNNIVRMVTGKRYYGDDVQDKEEAEIFKNLIIDIFENSAANNPSNYLPFLRFLGSKYEKQVKRIGKTVDKTLQRLLDECRKDREGNSMINHLMSLQDQDPEYYNDVTIKGLMMAMIIPGSDTTSVTIGWVMANLLNHRNVLNKARAEIDEKIGQDRLIDEEDISDLPYLQNIVSETFRLNPVSPVLLAREASKDIKVGGYDIPGGTTVLVNAWAIHRDPELWHNPEEFYPERFNGNKIKIDGSVDSVQTLMPFGNGRRLCPGAGLGLKTVTWTVGAMVQCFDWETMNGEKVDMEESRGIVMRNLKPIRAMIRPRPIIYKLVAEATS
ncbi:PREDICTED: cytochrome P450 81F1-like [Camelina sativa]|uniref:Cytochrome P450 81F1-like n=1 Tax=Camelina sativa TaxID=90675 RepID=A0ABM0UUT0_CAMSA|nr:PREDICTED: cytochrome P450 81F1-like [Camelina sativa]